jgi:hypothetical protein
MLRPLSRRCKEKIVGQIARMLVVAVSIALTGCGGDSEPPSAAFEAADAAMREEFQSNAVICGAEIIAEAEDSWTFECHYDPYSLSAEFDTETYHSIYRCDVKVYKETLRAEPFSGPFECDKEYS